MAEVARFNNATQRLWGKRVKPVVLVWETDDPQAPWRAQARLLEGEKVIKKFPEASASGKQGAKNLAADTAYQWLCAQYLTHDLANV